MWDSWAETALSICFRNKAGGEQRAVCSQPVYLQVLPARIQPTAGQMYSEKECVATNMYSLFLSPFPKQHRIPTVREHFHCVKYYTPSRDGLTSVRCVLYFLYKHCHFHAGDGSACRSRHPGGSGGRLEISPSKTLGDNRILKKDIATSLRYFDITLWKDLCLFPGWILAHLWCFISIFSEPQLLSLIRMKEVFFFLNIFSETGRVGNF